MSTHSLDVSGARPLTLTLNDPARTAVTAGAKVGDDATIQVSGFRELRFSLGAGVKIQTRRYVRRTHRRGPNGVAVKNEAGEYVYDESPYEEHVVVIPAGRTFFGRTSRLPGEPEDAYEGTPHTSVFTRREPDLHFLESGDLIAEVEVADLLAAQEGAD